MRIWILLFVVTVLASCSSTDASGTLTLDYQDFDPPSMASKVIGMDWWQWQKVGDSRPRQYDIKVIIYKDISQSKVEALYPVDPEKELDYRYLEKQKAIDYLDKGIKEDVLPSLTEKLKVTKSKILAWEK